MRDAFHEIVSGWTLYSGIDDLTDRIERAAVWTKAHGPLQPDEEATIELMIRCQIARGMPEFFGHGPDEGFRCSECNRWCELDELGARDYAGGFRFCLDCAGGEQTS